MQSPQNIKQRIKSIESTKQITNSMRLVSSSKVQKSLRHLEELSLFHSNIDKFLEGLLSANQDIESIYFKNDSDAPVGVVVISSDRSLCGAFNMNVARGAVQFCKKKKNPYIVAVGNRIKELFKKENIPIAEQYIGTSETPIYEEAKMLTYNIISHYLNGEVSKIYIVYTHFTSMLTQDIKIEQLLPYNDINRDVLKKEEFVLEPNLDELINGFMPTYISSSILVAMGQSATSEQSARITSMDTASKNSDQLVASLTRQYNKIRQEGITNEINEIVSGAMSTTM